MQPGSPDGYGAQFGKGLCYSLGLFLAHEADVKYALAEVQTMAAEGALQFEGKEKQPERVQAIIERFAAIRWFSQAANPVRALVIPSTFPEPLKRRLQAFRDKCTGWALPTQAQPRLNDVRWALAEAKELLRQLDEQNGVHTIKANSKALGQREPALRFTD